MTGIPDEAVSMQQSDDGGAEIPGLTPAAPAATPAPAGAAAGSPQPSPAALQAALQAALAQARDSAAPAPRTCGLGGLRAANTSGLASAGLAHRRCVVAYGAARLLPGQ
jgi:hypothetical protein